MLIFKDELKLTDREFEVLALRLYGLPFRKIAERLYLSHATVRKHAQTLLRKGNARNAIELFIRRFLPELEGEFVAGQKGAREPGRKGGSKGGCAGSGRG